MHITVILNGQNVMKLAAKEEIDVDEEGVGGAKRYFEAKAKMLEVGAAC